MNTKKLSFKSFVIAFFILTGLTAQQVAENISKEKDFISFKAYDIDESFNLNQFVFTFLRKEGGFSMSELKKLTEQSTAFNTIEDGSKMYREKSFGSVSRGVTSIYLDNTQILGMGINRLYLLDNRRLKEFSKIYVSNPSYDREIYLFTKSK
ncbi:hypothetical protein ACOSP6_16520 [Tenacibaculum sp. MEBiC06402]|uniref:hypothetical protein n=1 Tax=unclassified Tenacibaculum TaxID=2635139 RepID=UPI003B9A3253